MTFKEESDEWMKSLGYSVHSFNPDYTSITYWNPKDEYHPVIRCWIDGSDKNCECTGGSHFKWFIQTKLGPLQFKHPQIETIIKYFVHYEQLAERYKLVKDE